MKIVFVSNYFNHHQKVLCDSFNELKGVDFVFIATREMREERKLLGYNTDNPNYLFKSYLSKYNEKKSKFLIKDADILIFGNAPLKFLSMRKNKMFFKYSERFNKVDQSILKSFLRRIKVLINHYPFKNAFLLSASAYAPNDYNEIGLFKNRCYKFGYFPYVKNIDIHQCLIAKESNSILWCGRFIEWKRPEFCLEIAKRLKAEGYSFKIYMVGNGLLLENIQLKIIEENLEDYVCTLGAKKPEEVSNLMYKASIFLATSNKQEGWGAVVNEAMANGCAVIASHSMGSVPYLINNEDNGLIFSSESKDDLYDKVKMLLDDKEKCLKYGINAYNTINSMWNGKIAANRVITLYNSLLKEEVCNVFNDGPCSLAEVIKDDWM